jgi:hypothetical protein
MACKSFAGSLALGVVRLGCRCLEVIMKRLMLDLDATCHGKFRDVLANRNRLSYICLLWRIYSAASISGV